MSRTRARWIIRLSLIALPVLFIGVFAFLLFIQKEGMSPRVASQLLQDWMLHGKEQGNDLEQVFGKPNRAGAGPFATIKEWKFEEESFLTLKIFVIEAVTEEPNPIPNVRDGVLIYEGSKLWQHRWDRLKQRLGGTAKLPGAPTRVEPRP